MDAAAAGVGPNLAEEKIEGVLEAPERGRFGEDMRLTAVVTAGDEDVGAAELDDCLILVNFRPAGRLG